MLLRLFGPVEMVDGGRAVGVQAPRERMVLVALATHLNRPVDTDHLIDVVWEAAPPRTAIKTLHTHVHRLRRLLEQAGAAVAVETTPSGYRLVADTHAVDVWHFEALAEAGHRAVARRRGSH